VKVGHLVILRVGGVEAIGVIVDAEVSVEIEVKYEAEVLAESRGGQVEVLVESRGDQVEAEDQVEVLAESREGEVLDEMTEEKILLIVILQVHTALIVPLIVVNLVKVHGTRTTNHLE